MVSKVPLYLGDHDGQRVRGNEKVLPCDGGPFKVETLGVPGKYCQKSLALSAICQAGSSNSPSNTISSERYFTVNDFVCEYEVMLAIKTSRYNNCLVI